ncbi:hypothetical protein L1049_003748 [Liquidambar formosana]|uniref:Pre-mRNA polyadenylation factor Fip1 domain-containing protein n=1 Tax=Liquidambar formosana TaxID=63359 RepID=A0AAP0RM99_LIQFO
MENQVEFAVPAEGSNSSGHGSCSGMDFTLPYYKNIFDIDIDSFEEKPWRQPGVDASEYFNFGFDEESWKAYCKQLELVHLEKSNSLRKICVYESRQSNQDYDPDMPPELAAAIREKDIFTKNPRWKEIQIDGCGEHLPSTSFRPQRIFDSDELIEEQCYLEDTRQRNNCAPKRILQQQDYNPALPPEHAVAVGLYDASAEMDFRQLVMVGQGAGTTSVQPPTVEVTSVQPPTKIGRAIPVQIGYEERISSMDTRPPRIRDSKSTIEIALQDSIDEDPTTAISQGSISLQSQASKNTSV